MKNTLVLIARGYAILIGLLVIAFGILTAASLALGENALPFLCIAGVSLLAAYLFGLITEN